MGPYGVRIAARWVMLAGGFALPLVPAAHGQTVSGTTAPSSATADASAPADGGITQELKKNPIEILKELEPPANAPYLIGPGDELTIQVTGRPELTGKQTVGPDGKISLPSVGSIAVADLSRDEASALIEKKLRDNYEGVTVSVEVDTYTSNNITLLGAVANPGVMSFKGTPTLLEVISRGGMSSQAAMMGAGALTSAVAPSPYPEECIIYRGDTIMFSVQLRALLEENNNLANYRLKRGDIVYVPGASKYVSVFGAVGRPGTLRLEAKSTVPQLLAQAGGIDDKAGKYPPIRIIHRGDDKSPSKITTVSYKDVLAGKPLDVTLHSGDIIYVPESGLTRFGYTMQQVAPLVNLLELGVLVH